MRVLVACEFSGVVRDAFTRLGHDALSCDLQPTETAGKHYLGDVRDIAHLAWDLIIAHPPCTHLCVSGARWFKDKVREQSEALEFVRYLLSLPCLHIALENPISIISSHIRKPDQIIQPWMFGHVATKSTCLWLKGLPLLTPTNVTPFKNRLPVAHFMSPSRTRSKDRSRTFTGVAAAMAEQWGGIVADVVTGVSIVSVAI